MRIGNHCVFIRSFGVFFFKNGQLQKYMKRKKKLINSHVCSLANEQTLNKTKNGEYFRKMCNMRINTIHTEQQQQLISDYIYLYRFCCYVQMKDSFAYVFAPSCCSIVTHNVVLCSFVCLYDTIFRNLSIYIGTCISDFSFSLLFRLSSVSCIGIRTDTHNHLLME